MPTPELAFEIHFAADLASTDVLERFQRTLATISPEFCSNLSVSTHDRDRTAIVVDVAREGSLRDAVLIKGAVRGPLFARLEAAGPGTAGRRFGSVMLRGKARATFLSVSFDEHVPLQRIGEQWLFSNSISARTSAARIGGVSRIEWTRQVITSLADHPSVLWGAAYDVREFQERNLHQGGDGTWALGRDASRSLPGLFWLNVFGPAYRKLVGDHRLRETGAVDVQAIGPAVVMRIYDRPDEWAGREGRQRHRQVLKEIGPQYFFDRDDPTAETEAPPFTLL